MCVALILNKIALAFIYLQFFQIIFFKYFKNVTNLYLLHIHIRIYIHRYYTVQFEYQLYCLYQLDYSNQELLVWTKIFGTLINVFLRYYQQFYYIKYISTVNIPIHPYVN